MRALIITSAITTLAALAVAFKFSRVGYESPAYKVQLANGPFEIRDYPSLMLASTPMARQSFDEDQSFRRLFRYISGANATEEKIAMTTPVLMTEEGNGRMSFIAPHDLAAAGPPSATDNQVQLETMQGGRFATFRYSGSWDSRQIAEAKQKLLMWTQQQGLETVGLPITAGYDPPFTPPFLRRNEILIRLAA